MMESLPERSQLPMIEPTRYRIPLFDLCFDEREYEAVSRTLRSHWISMGPQTEEFERQFGSLLGTTEVAAVTSCTAALHLALKALDVDPADEVIVPSLTFVATVAAVRYLAATPVFCDVTSAAWPTIDPEAIERAITHRTKAIVVMHYGGFPCAMDSIMEIARRHGVRVVEDAAHAPGSKYAGRPLGTLGDLGCFSFFANKNIATAEGGMVTARDPDHMRRIKLLRSHGMTTLSFERARGHSTGYDVIDVGYNYRIDDIRSTLGIVQLGRLSSDLDRRRFLRERYVSRLASRGDIIVPFRDSKDPVSNYIFTITLSPDSPADRGAVREELAVRGIQTSIHYPAVHRFSVYRSFTRHLPATEYIADRTITLPMYPGLTTEQVDEVCDSLCDVLDSVGVKR